MCFVTDTCKAQIADHIVNAAAMMPKSLILVELLLSLWVFAVRKAHTGNVQLCCSNAGCKGKGAGAAAMHTAADSHGRR